MIQIRSILGVADNSGAKKVSCIKVVGASNKLFADVGDVIIANVKEAIFDAKVKKGEVVRAVVVRSVKAIRRIDGSYIRFDDPRFDAREIKQGVEHLNGRLGCGICAGEYFLLMCI